MKQKKLNADNNHVKTFCLKQNLFIVLQKEDLYKNKNLVIYFFTKQFIINQTS